MFKGRISFCTSEVSILLMLVDSHELMEEIYDKENI